MYILIIFIQHTFVCYIVSYFSSLYKNVKNTWIDDIFFQKKNEQKRKIQNFQRKVSHKSKFKKYKVLMLTKFAFSCFHSFAH